jgi:hypothetical protein
MDVSKRHTMPDRERWLLGICIAEAVAIALLLVLPR